MSFVKYLVERLKQVFALRNGPWIAGVLGKQVGDLLQGGAEGACARVQLDLITERGWAIWFAKLPFSQEVAREIVVPKIKSEIKIGATLRDRSRIRKSRGAEVVQTDLRRLEGIGYFRKGQFVFGVRGKKSG